MPLLAASNPVLDWSAIMMSAIRADNTGPTLSTRNLAILNVATYDAVNSITRTHQPYRFQIPTEPDTSMEAAVIAAGREVMLALYPPFRARTEELYLEQLAMLPATPGTTKGLALGREMAVRVLALRRADGSSTSVPYIPSSLPGQWQRTPPFSRPPLTPQWRYVDPFCIPDLTPFLPKPPPPLDSEEYARDFEQVRALGGKNSPLRTAEQSLIAVYWSDFSYTAMPPGHWHEIAANICQSHGLSIPDSARLLALLGLAQADAAILCWEAKYRCNLWRPVTAIRRADEDGNPLTQADPDWDHYLDAPPFPAYTSGHSTFSQTSAQVLKHFFGTDALTFTTQSDSVPGVFRVFHSLQACADEVGMSRIYGGIHFQFDNTEGKRTGGMIGDVVSVNFLLPNSVLPLVRIEGCRDGVPVLRVHGHIGQPFVLE
ncbi:MAG: vanadium-dependent haloperoxidase, partial [Parvularculaceae bacterium]|nr:vanadium-dependent haloperoxidase [Parvularculaceae bacterium]